MTRDNLIKTSKKPLVIVQILSVIVASIMTINWARQFTHGWEGSKNEFFMACIWWVVALTSVVAGYSSNRKIAKFFRKPAVVLYSLGIVILIISAGFWWRLVYSSPTNVFDRMLANSLSTSSVTKTTNQADDSQKLTQTTVLVAQPKQIVRSTSVLGQSDDPDTRITTESIGTPKADFVRYTDIKTSQRNPDGNPFDFSSVIGVWGRTDQGDPDSSSAQLFNQTALGVVPSANLPLPLRRSLLEQIKNDGVYKIDTSSVKRQLVNGRPVYSYKVSVLPVAYVTMLKNFARSLGITRLEQVDPSQYKDSEPLKFTFDIDVWSGQLTKIAYDGSVRTEVYQAYGARTQIEAPASFIAVDELQSRLQQIR